MSRVKGILLWLLKKARRKSRALDTARPNPQVWFCHRVPAVSSLWSSHLDERYDDQNQAAIARACRRTPPEAQDYAVAYPDLMSALGQDPAALLSHWQTHGWRESRTPFGMALFDKRSTSLDNYRKASSHVSFYGMLDATGGMGRAARQYRTALQVAGFSVEEFSIDFSRSPFTTFPETREADRAPTSKRRSKVNIFHLNANQVNIFFGDGRSRLLDDAFNIGIWVWELSHFPGEWASAFGAFDEIWVPSDFCRRSIGALSPVPVFIMPHIVEVGPHASQDSQSDHVDDYFSDKRARIKSTTSEVFTFATYFDVGSNISRKNPEGVIKAFLCAFGERQDVKLIVKYHAAHHDSEGVAKVRALCLGTSNIRMIGNVLSEPDLARLTESIDCFVTPHRGEGFGLAIAEFLAQEIPVISTYHSGERDFCDEEDLFALRSKYKEIDPGVGAYPAGACWMDVDESVLVARLQEVLKSPISRKVRATALKRRLAESFSLASLADRLKHRLGDLGVLNGAETFVESWGASKYISSKFTGGHERRFSIVICLNNSRIACLARCIESIRQQSHVNWELILLDIGFKDTRIRQFAKNIKGTDPRIRVFEVHPDGSFAEAMNAGVGASSGAFLLLVSAYVEFAQTAMSELADAFLRDPQPDFIYTAELYLEIDTNKRGEVRRPPWSPEYLESVMYLGCVYALKKSIFLSIEGFEDDCQGTEMYAFALALLRSSVRAHYLDRAIYTFFSHSQPVFPPGLTLDIVERQRGALAEHLRIQGMKSSVTIDQGVGCLRIKDCHSKQSKSALLIFKDSLGDDERLASEVSPKLDPSLAWAVAKKCQIMTPGVAVGDCLSLGASSFKDTLHHALTSEADVVIFLHASDEVIDADWLDVIYALARRPVIGAVSGLLLEGSNISSTIGDDRDLHCPHAVNNHIIVDTEFLAIAPAKLREIGLSSDYRSIDACLADLCFRTHAAGFRNVFTPFARLLLSPGLTRRGRISVDDRELMLRQWDSYIYKHPEIRSEKFARRHLYRTAGSE